MATHSSMLAWGNLTDRRVWWAIIRGAAKESDTTQALNNHNKVGTYCLTSQFLKYQSITDRLPLWVDGEACNFTAERDE